MDKYKLIINIEIDFESIFSEIPDGLFSEDPDSDELVEDYYKESMIYDSLKNSYLYALNKNMEDLVSDKENGLYKYLKHHNECLLQVSEQICMPKNVTLEKVQTNRTMKTIARQLNVSEFPFEIKDKNGNEIYYENSNGYWNKSEYDSNGNEIYYEESDGFWSKYKYDSNGNQVYYEYSDGYWYKREYDSNGNRIYYENSNGYWYKWEYDSNGNQIYYEDSNGQIIDNRPKQSCNGKVIEVDGKKYKLIEV
jgi:hypothetical protein